MPRSLRNQFPLRLILGQEDATGLLDNGASWSNVDPGGFESASLEIPKDMPSALRGTRVRIDCGLGVAWEGRVSQIQRSLGQRTTITCEGYAAVLKDADLSMPFVDRDLLRWRGASVQRKINLVKAGRSPADAQVAADTTSGAPALECQQSGNWLSTTLPYIEGWYDAGPLNRIALLAYAWRKNATIDPTDPNWLWMAGLSSDDLATTANYTANLSAAGPGSGTLTPSQASRYAQLVLQYTTAAGGAANALYAIYWSALAVFGDHGLPIRGPAPGALYTSDIAKYAALRAPGLALGVCPDMTGYLLPHYTQYVPVTLNRIVDDMALAAGWHWGVWEALSPLTGADTPRFDFRPRPAPGSFTGFCRRSDTDEPDIREDPTQLYDTARVHYTDVAGVDGVATVTLDNPLLDEAGLHRPLELDAGTSDQATAAVLGLQALALSATQERIVGSIQISAAIDSAAGPMAAWMLRSGIDRLRVADLPSTDAFGAHSDVPLRRVEASLSQAGISTSVEVGQGASLVETLQSRFATAGALSAQSD